MFHLFRVPLVRYLIALALVLACVDSFVPVSFGAENGLFEDIQVGVLLGGALGCALKVGKSEGRYQCLWIAAALLCLLLAGRELSWGRVFFPPIRAGIYPPLKSLPYGPFVYPIVGATMVAIIALVVRGKIVQYLKKNGVPFTQLALLFVVTLLAVDGEKLHMIPWSHGMLVEEFCELCVYGLFVWMLTKMRPS